MSGQGDNSQSTDTIDEPGSSGKKRVADDDEERSPWKYQRSHSPCSTSGLSGRSSAVSALGGAGGRGTGARARRQAAETAIKHAADPIIDPEMT